MLIQLLNLLVIAAVCVVGTLTLLAVLGNRWRSFQVLNRLYLKILTTSVLALAKFLWKPDIERKAMGHMAELPQQGDWNARP